MEKFVLAGKAKTVFQLIELMAKGEKAKKAEDKKNKQQHNQQELISLPLTCGLPKISLLASSAYH